MQLEIVHHNHTPYSYLIRARLITCQRKSVSISCKVRNLKSSYYQIQRLFL